MNFKCYVVIFISLVPFLNCPLSLHFCKYAASQLGRETFVVCGAIRLSTWCHCLQTNDRAGLVHYYLKARVRVLQAMTWGYYCKLYFLLPYGLAIFFLHCVWFFTQHYFLIWQGYFNSQPQLPDCMMLWLSCICARFILVVLEYVTGVCSMRRKCHYLKQKRCLRVQEPSSGVTRLITSVPYSNCTDDEIDSIKFNTSPLVSDLPA